MTVEKISNTFYCSKTESTLKELKNSRKTKRRVASVESVCQEMKEGMMRVKYSLAKLDRLCHKDVVVEE